MTTTIYDPLLILEEEYKGYTIKVYPDDFFESPREWDNLGTMACWHNRYLLGDEQPKTPPEDFLTELAIDIDPTVEDRIDYWDIEKLVNKVIENNVLILPLYLFDHSGITMSTSSFNCPWDSGQVGYIYVTKQQLRDAFGTKKVTKKMWKRAEEILISEVQVYDQYIRGDIYTFVIEDDEGEIIDSCAGFYNSEYLLNDAKNVIDSLNQV